MRNYVWLGSLVIVALRLLILPATGHYGSLLWTIDGRLQSKRWTWFDDLRDRTGMKRYDQMKKAAEEILLRDICYSHIGRNREWMNFGKGGSCFLTIQRRSAPSWCWCFITNNMSNIMTQGLVICVLHRWPYVEQQICVLQRRFADTVCQLLEASSHVGHQHMVSRCISLSSLPSHASSFCSQS